ncbi:MAG: hypothetical protein K2M43_02775 [Mycoplasmoidaceae bacterium]|nr:hypothetical protein [Mycoplasmoidaceae bacterium]
MNGFRYQFDKFVFSDNRKKGVKNFTISLITIFLSMIIAVLICMAIYKKGSLFADIFNVIFTNPFSSSGQVDYLITNIAIFAVAACSFLFAFKSGLFNIGISGQMLFGAMIATIVGQRIGQNATGGYIVPFGLGQIIIVLIAVISGGLVGGLIGLLKAKLNMNEVVSSIMLN